jgi:hypothetical protein
LEEDIADRMELCGDVEKYGEPGVERDRTTFLYVYVFMFTVLARQEPWREW